MPKQGLEQTIIDALEPTAAERGIDVVDGRCASRATSRASPARR